jgi:hypothetical protein
MVVEEKMNLAESLDKCKDFSDVFEVVRRCVDKSLGRRRNGLMLGLTDLPLHIGAFHAVPSNVIMINRKILNAVMHYDKKLVNAYVFHVLLHEYLHTLGFMSEEDVGTLSHIISKKYLGEKHPSTIISKYGMAYVFPRLAIDPETDRTITIVENFDSSNLSYIG